MMNNEETKHFSDDDILSALMGETVAATGLNMNYRLFYDGAKFRNQFTIKCYDKTGNLFGVLQGDEDSVRRTKLV